MREELNAGGYQVDVVAINNIGGEASQEQLISRCSFDLLQDETEVGAWNLMGGKKDDIFIYREGGTLSPSGYLPMGGPLNTILSTVEGYQSVYDAIKAVCELGTGENCNEAGWQVPGNANQDESLDLSDVISLLVHLFINSSGELPCQEGTLPGEGNRALLDLNQDTELDLGDVVYLLQHLFTGGPPPILGTKCIRVPACPSACEMATGT